MGDNYDDIATLRSKKRYDNLDYQFIGSVDNSECNELDKELKNDSFYFFCMSIKGNLKNYDNLNFNDFFDNYKCKYLNMWIYDRLSSIYPNVTGIKAARVIQFIIKLWDDFKLKDKCDKSFFDYISNSDNNDNYINMKKLYDYALNYDLLHFDIEKANHRCTPKEEVYIRRSIELYNKVKKDCEVDATDKFYCAVLRDITQYISEDKLLGLECKNIENFPPPAAIGGEKASSGMDLATARTPEINIDSPRGSETDLTSPHHQQQLHGGQDQLMAVSLPEDGGESIVSSSMYDSIKKNTIRFSPPLIGFSFFSLMLYKFTPFGSFINRNILGKRIIPRNMEMEDRRELYENNYMELNSNLRDIRPNIGYHSS
ncbi:Plasmodium vivax Vir protein, putative [Plasmodium vivax]|nr:Plasmodium vivax Vir protein, putative [Plasmodium vivax]